MVSPYVLQYDFVLLGLPVAWMGMEALDQGALPYEAIILAIAWILPRIALPLSEDYVIPIAPMVMILLMVAILRRVRHSLAIG
jgi:hypothetical protein